ncbi:hypothetical protein C0989_000794 [Termitomyces sp. Mn162]|nr:hypothetical protein C0989_000794 [Termitomyces sp. Mn162]
MAELLGRQNNVGFTYYGKRLKDFRKVLYKSLNPPVILECWNDLLHEQSRELCQSLLVEPERFRDIIEENIQKFIVIFTYGFRPDSDHLKLAQMVAQHTGEALQPARWMKRGQKRVSFVHKSLEGLGDKHCSEEEDIIMFAAGSLLSGKTMTSIFLSFIGTIVNHPGVQERAYMEILDVVGSEELPCLHHRDNLPYIECIIKEVHRCYPAIPMITRSNDKEDIYEGLRIPQKSWVIGNVW